MRKSLSLVLFVSILSVCLVATSYASTLPVEQQTELGQLMAAPAVVVPFVEVDRPATTGEAIVSEVKTFDGEKPSPEPRDNSPGYSTDGF